MSGYPRIVHFEKMPEASDKLYVVQNKLDGSNIRLEVLGSRCIEAWTRNMKLGTTADFGTLRDEIKRLGLFFDKVHSFQQANNVRFSLFGELHGTRCNRLAYNTLCCKCSSSREPNGCLCGCHDCKMCKEKLVRCTHHSTQDHLLFFDAMIFDDAACANGTWLSQKELRELFSKLDGLDLLVWTSEPMTLEDAFNNGMKLCYDACKVQCMRGDRREMIEGIVIKPWLENSSPWKIKSPDYVAIEHVKQVKVPKQTGDLRKDLISKCCMLITSHRIQDQQAKKTYLHDSELARDVVLDAQTEHGIDLTKDEKKVAIQHAKDEIKAMRKMHDEHMEVIREAFCL